ncbi:MAG: MBL fold metallo-hydrolase [Promethearchaeota archaeon]
MIFEKIEFNSIYFDIFKLDEGIYAIIFNQEMGSSSNAGIFDLGNKTIIFDTLMDPFSTRDLIKASKLITNKDPFLLINSHFHLDHVFGNRLFPSSMPIISSPGTLDQFNKQLLEQFKQFKERAPTELKNTKELLKNVEDPNKKIELQNDMVTWKEIQAPNFDLRPPDLLLYNKVLINGVSRSVEIINIGSAHSHDDIIALFPEKKICFMGDLLFTNLDPSWATGSTGMSFAVDPKNFKNIMETYFEKNIEVFVPGHGTLSSKKGVKDTIEYLEKYFLKKED